MPNKKPGCGCGVSPGLFSIAFVLALASSGISQCMDKDASQSSAVEQQVELSDVDSTGTHKSAQVTDQASLLTREDTVIGSDSFAVLNSDLAGVVNADSNVRSGPGTEFLTVGGLKTGTSVTILGADSQRTWYRIGKDEWIAAFLVTTQEPSIPSGTPYPTPSTGVVSNAEMTVTPDSVFFIANFPALVGQRVESVEDVLGAPVRPTEFSVGEMSTYSGAGESREYYLGDYILLALYDRSGVLRTLQFMDGLSNKKFTLSAWPSVLGAVGLPSDVDPDGSFPIALRWQNLAGFKVAVIADGLPPKGSIWTVQVSLPD